MGPDSPFADEDHPEAAADQRAKMAGAITSAAARLAESAPRLRQQPPHSSARVRKMAATPTLSIIHSRPSAWIDAGRAAAARADLSAARPTLWIGSRRLGPRRSPPPHRPGRGAR